MRYTLALMVLLISTWIQSSAQTGDTITCYTNSELKRIATRIIRASECDTLLILANQTIDVQQSQITNLSTQVCTQDSVIQLLGQNVADYNHMLIYKDQMLADSEKQLAALSKKTKWIKAGWIGTGVLSIGLILLVGFN